MNAATATMLDTALDYARRGWPVFPLHSIKDGRCTCGEGCGKDAGKHPRIAGGFTHASTVELSIRNWWGRWSDANVGIATGKGSGVFVVDVDPRHGGDDTLRDLETQHGAVPDTVESLTGGGGRHIFFRYPGYHVKSSAGVLGAGLDIRADGGCVVAPPSIHLSGQRYEWEASSHPDDVEIAEAPAWLLAMLTAEATSSNGHDRFTVPEMIRDGQRNDTFYKLARSCKAREMSQGATLAALQAENAARCEPPLDAREVEQIVRHAYEQPDRPEFTATGNGGVKQETAPTPEPSWPVLAEEALHGLAGEIVGAIDPFTEADPVATLVHVLVGFGNLIGSGPHASVGHDPHTARLNAAVVGKTSGGRKGTAWGNPKHLLKQIDEAWARGRVKTGLSSGEGLIYHVRDSREEMQPIKDKGRVVDYQTVIVDSGESDKRLLIIEPEFATVLRRMAGEGNTLSSIIREAWDSGCLSTLAKNSPIKATGAHVSIVAHITRDELLRYLDGTERANGFANRFIWLLVRKSKNLPDGEAVPESILADLVNKLREAVTFAQTVGEIKREAETRELWHAVYPALAADRPGMTGAILSRAEAQVLRLSVVYALLDFSGVIRAEHLAAALALWEYSETSARYIFGDSTGDDIADRIYRELQTRGELSETELSDLFGRHQKADRIHAAIGLLERAGRIVSETVETGGRRKKVWRLAK